MQTVIQGGPRIALRPILAPDVEQVGSFLHRELNPRVSAAAWVSGMQPPWMSDAPNHGFLLSQGGEVVGVNLAFYSTRPVAGRTERFCNVGALCVVEAHREQTLRLLRAVLRQPGYHFTDLSPSGTVVTIDRRLGFRDLDTTVSLVPNLPWPTPRGLRIVPDPKDIARLATPENLRVVEDHQTAPAVQHTLLVEGAQQCYVVSRRDRRKDLPLFSTVLYVSNATLFQRRARNVFAHLRARTGAPFTLVEGRVSRLRPPGAVWTGAGRPKLYRSHSLSPAQVDDLYSELTQIAW